MCSVSRTLGLRPVNCALPYLVYHPSRCICLPMCCFILLYSCMSLYPISVLTYGLLCLPQLLLCMVTRHHTTHTVPPTHNIQEDSGHIVDLTGLCCYNYHFHAWCKSRRDKGQTRHTARRSGPLTTIVPGRVRQLGIVPRVGIAAVSSSAPLPPSCPEIDVLTGPQQSPTREGPGRVT